MSVSSLVPAEHIQSRILVLRGVRGVLDRDLAVLYGVTNKRLKEQVRRNLRKFPEDFMFELTETEKTEVAAKCGHLRSLKYSPVLPYAFTEHGAIQAASILSSDTATEMSVEVARAFIRLRQLMVDHKALASKLAEPDAHLGTHDRQLAAIVEAIRQLAAPSGPLHGREIGYHQGNR